MIHKFEKIMLTTKQKLSPQHVGESLQMLFKFSSSTPMLLNGFYKSFYYF